MDAPVFIGDEISACGYRLAGIDTHIPGKGSLLADIQSLCERSSLVLLSAEYANQLASEELHPLLVRTHGAVVVVPDVRTQHTLADLATDLRRQLGVLE